MAYDAHEIILAARNLMLHAKAANGVVTVPEWDAIALLHALPDVEQVPQKEDDGSYTWTTLEHLPSGSTDQET